MEDANTRVEYEFDEMRPPVSKPQLQLESRDGRTRVLLSEAALHAAKVAIESAEPNDAKRSKLMEFIDRHTDLED